MYVIGIDPGNTESALTIYESVNDRIELSFKDVNPQILLWIIGNLHRYMPFCMIAIEKVASYGMAVGETVFETVHWSGRFHQLILEQQRSAVVHRITRNEVKNHLCHSSRAKDANIRQALIDRFGAPGTKKKPGKTYGISSDQWAALAVAVTCFDKYSTSDIKF